MSNYITEAQKIAKKTMPDFSAMSSAEIEAGIAAVSKALIGFGIGPMERIVLHEERKAAREELARRAKAAGETK